MVGFISIMGDKYNFDSDSQAELTFKLVGRMLNKLAIVSREIACYKNAIFSIEVMAYRYHVYRDSWDVILGEELSSKRELGNHKSHCTCGSGEITSYHHSFQMNRKFVNLTFVHGLRQVCKTLK